MVHIEQTYKSILVTGGGGFIGSHFAKLLITFNPDQIQKSDPLYHQLLNFRPTNVVVVDEMNDFYDPEIKWQNIRSLKQLALQYKIKFTFYHVNICNQEKMEEIIQKESIDAIVHLAARAGVRPSIEEPALYMQSNVLGTTVLLDLYQKYRKQIHHFVYASSSSVYGNSPVVPFKETHQITPYLMSPYAASKLSCEMIAQSYANMFQLKLTGLRFFTVYGPGGRPDMAPFKFLDWIMRGKPIQQFGEGDSSRDYTFVADIVDGILRSLLRKNAEPHSVYNLGNSDPITLKSYIQLIEEITEKKAIIQILPKQTGDVEKTFADIEKAKKELGYMPKTDLKTGMKATLHWWKSIYSIDENSDSGVESESSSPTPPPLSRRNRMIL